MNLTKDEVLFKDDIIIDDNIEQESFTEIKLFETDNSDETPVNSIDNVAETEDEPLFRVVIPERRTWFYSFKCFFKGISFIKRWFGTEIKALPAPADYKY